MHGDASFDEADLNGLVDGRIDPARAAALEESLESDPGARARLAAWRRQNDSLRTMFASVLVEPVPVRLLPVSIGAQDRGEARERAGRHRLVAAVASAVLGAGLVGFALGALASFGTDGFGLLPAPARSPGAAPAGAAETRDFAARAAEAHRTFLTDPARPVEIGPGDEVRLVRWLRRRVGAGLRIPNFAGQGWSFMGGRIVPGREGPAAFLAYGNGADRLGLLVSAGEAGDGRVSAADGAVPLGVATFGSDGYGFALTADRGPDWLDRNLAPLRASVEAQGRAGGETAP